MICICKYDFRLIEKLHNKQLCNMRANVIAVEFRGAYPTQLRSSIPSSCLTVDGVFLFTPSLLTTWPGFATANQGIILKVLYNKI